MMGAGGLGLLGWLLGLEGTGAAADHEKIRRRWCC